MPRMRRTKADRATLAEEKCLDAIVYFFEEHGVVPTVRELASALNVGGANWIAEIMVHLEYKGYLRRAGGGTATKGRSRCYSVAMLGDGTRVRPALVGDSP